MKEKHIYIDESGDPKNTKSCVICFLVFDNTTFFNQISLDMDNFKLRRFNNESTELHFNKESFTTKRLFFKLLIKYNFKIYFYQTDRLDQTLSYHNYFIKSIKKNLHIFNHSKIYIDGDMSKNKNLLQKIKHLLKAEKILIKSIKFSNSRTNLFIQFTDMFAGCIRRKIDRGSREDKELFNLIKKFIH